MLQIYQGHLEWGQLLAQSTRLTMIVKLCFHFCYLSAMYIYWKNVSSTKQLWNFQRKNIFYKAVRRGLAAINAMFHLLTVRNN